MNEDIWATVMAGDTPRNIALLVVSAILVGNVLCELGDLLAIRLGLDSHYFNKYLLAIGLLGMLGFGVALLGR